MYLRNYARQREVYRALYAGGSRYIPLCISLKNTFSINRWEYVTDWPYLLANEQAKAEGIRDIGSDQIPGIVLRFDPVPLLSMFGAEVVPVGGRPFAEPVFHSIEEAARLQVPSLDAGILPRIVRAIDWFRKNAPADIPLATPPETDPFDVLLLLFGSDVLLWMAEEPETIHHALRVITEAFIRVQRQWKTLLGEPPREKVTYLGNWIPGIRVAADALVNLSPAMIREFCWPVFSQIADEFGPILVHYCPSPGQKYYHVLPAVLECPHVLGVDTSGGVDYFDSPENPSRLSTQGVLIGDCGFKTPARFANTDIVAASTNINRFSFKEREWEQIEDWLARDFMQLSTTGQRGLILRTTVTSVAEGRELFALWQERLQMTAR
jgi:hypothetical protein